MLTTTTFSDQRSDGGQTGPMDLQIAAVPHDRYTQGQVMKVFDLLGVNRPLEVDQRCIVSLDGMPPLLRRGVVLEVLEGQYVVLLDGATAARAVPNHQAWSERSPIEFTEIAMLTGTKRPFVSSMAMSKNILPPPKAGRPLKGKAPRKRHSIGLDPVLMKWIEGQREDGESFADAVNRLLTAQMTRTSK